MPLTRSCQLTAFTTLLLCSSALSAAPQAFFGLTLDGWVLAAPPLPRVARWTAWMRCTTVTHEVTVSRTTNGFSDCVCPITAGVTKFASIMLMPR